MRLTQNEKQAILNALRTQDSSARVFLFGSRTDDAKQGGDIDLLVLSEHFDKYKARKARWHIQEILGEQKIDIVFSKAGTEPFVSMIMQQAQELK